MKKYPRGRAPTVTAILALTLAHQVVLHAQDFGAQTFNDLVSQAIVNPPRPQPTPALTPVPLPIEKLRSPEAERVIVTSSNIPTVAVAASPSPSPNKLFSQPTIGLEYDYRFNQQKILDRFATDVNEAHSSFSFKTGLTKFQLEYFHLWLNATNDTSLKKSDDADVLKVGVTQSLFTSPTKDPNKDITQEVVFSVPVFFREDNLDALTSVGRHVSDIDSLTTNPFLLLSVSRAIDKPKPKEDLTPHRKAKLSLAPGYRYSASETNYTNVNLPSVHGWKGQSNLLARVDYDATESLSVNGAVTWSHYTNFYSSDSSLTPDRDIFSLAAGIVYKPKICPLKDPDKTRPLILGATYQYDGFNRDFYQHSLTLVGSYTFY